VLHALIQDAKPVLLPPVLAALLAKMDMISH